MSLFMDLDSDWLLNGSQLIADDDSFSNTLLSSWEGYNASAPMQINGYVTVHDPATAVQAMDYGVEMDSFVSKSSDMELQVEQFCPELLPGSPEMRHLTNTQLQQYIIQLEMVDDGVQSATNISSVPSPISIPKQHMIDWGVFQPTTSVTLNFEHTITAYPDQSFATVPEFDAEDEDVIDLLNQLSDSVDGDMSIDPVDLEAFVSFPLDPVSPDDVESLISSQLPFVDSRGTKTASASFHAVAATEKTEPLSTLQAPDKASVVAYEPMIEKRRKKQDQNKSAAIRYRQKKRNESGAVMSSCEELERRNIELKTKVSEMTKEVDYLKCLIEEICAA